YDNLLMSLGGVDLPALGFGMGDVVLTELLRDRGLLPSAGHGPQVFVASETAAMARDVRRAATALRLQGVCVEYALRDQQLMKQIKVAKSAGASFILTLHDRANENGPKGEDGKPLRHSWSPEPPKEWDALLTNIDL